MDSSISRPALPVQGRRFVGLRQAVAHRWPALLGAAVVTIAVPAIAFASGTSYFSNQTLETAIDAASYGVAIMAHGYSGGTAVLATGDPGINAVADPYVAQSQAIQANSEDGTTIYARGVKTVIDAHSSQGRAILTEGPQGGIEAKSGNTAGLTSGAGPGVAVSATGEKTGLSSVGDVGVRAQGKTYGVLANADTTANSFAAGVQAKADEAVVARGTNIGVDATAIDTAVAGVASQGVGGLFGGKEAPIRMFKAQAPGAPTSGLHHAGELYVDSAGLLFYCTADGTPGTWHQVALK